MGAQFMAGLFWPAIALIAIVPIYFAHREKMAKLRAATSDPNPQLLARIQALEKRCEKLQEQVNEAHILIHDEQRELDRKLAARFDATTITANEPSAAESAARRKTIGADVRI